MNKDMFGNFLCCFLPNINNNEVDSTGKKKKPAYYSTVRGNLVRTYEGDVEQDFYIDREHELGKGGCGVVIVGEQKDTRAQYAIKIVNKSTAERGRLDRELKLLKDVDHTNIVRLFSVYDAPKYMYFVMELCLGGHLGVLISRQPQRFLDEDWAKKLCRQLLSAVAHIHARGIAHRDIKLQNILLDSTNDKTAQVKLIDFGYGSRYVGALPMRTKCGTPYTTAPEVIRECYDERCDLWSTGVVLYIMLCGRRPFEALDIAGPLSDAGKAAMITNILAGRFHFNHRPWQHVSKVGISFVKALLHQDYRTRIRANEALEHPWFQDTNLLQSSASTLVSAKSFRAVTNIKKSIDSTNMQRTGMLALVFGINARTANDLRSVFQSFDIDGSGMLSRKEFQAALTTLAPELSVEDISRLFDMVDIDKNQSISFTEFLAATLDPREVDIEELNKAFQLLDEDGNGYISREEIRNVVKALVEQSIENAIEHKDASIGALTTRMHYDVERRIDEIFNQVDLNNDGTISHAEFLWAMTGMAGNGDSPSPPLDPISPQNSQAHMLDRQASSSSPFTHNQSSVPLLGDSQKQPSSRTLPPLRNQSSNSNMPSTSNNNSSFRGNLVSTNSNSRLSARGLFGAQTSFVGMLRSQPSKLNVVQEIEKSSHSSDYPEDGNDNNDRNDDSSSVVSDDTACIARNFGPPPRLLKNNMVSSQGDTNTNSNNNNAPTTSSSSTKMNRRSVAPSDLNKHIDVREDEQLHNDNHHTLAEEKSEDKSHCSARGFFSPSSKSPSFRNSTIIDSCNANQPLKMMLPPINSSEAMQGNNGGNVRLAPLSRNTSFKKDIQQQQQHQPQHQPQQQLQGGNSPTRTPFERMGSHEHQLGAEPVAPFPNSRAMSMSSVMKSHIDSQQVPGSAEHSQQESNQNNKFIGSLKRIISMK